MGTSTQLQEGRDGRTATTAGICTNVKCCAVIPDDGVFRPDCPECRAPLIKTCPHCGIELPASLSNILFCPTCGDSLRNEESSNGRFHSLRHHPTVKFILFMLLVAVGVVALYSDPTFRSWIWLVASAVLLSGWYFGTSAHFDVRNGPDGRTMWLATTCRLIGIYLLVVCVAEMLLVIITVLSTGQAGQLQDFLH